MSTSTIEHAGVNVTTCGKKEDVKVSSNEGEAGVAKTLGVFDGVVFMVTCMVGSGLYFSPGEAAQLSKSPCAAILSFVVGGFLSLIGALVYSELGTSFVSAAAEAHYSHKAFGRSSGFAYTWACFFIIGSGACCGISIVVGNYTIEAMGLLPSEHLLMGKLISIGSIFFIGIINTFIPTQMANLNRLMVALKLLGAVIVMVGSIYGPQTGTLRQDAFIFNQHEGCFAGTDWSGFVSSVVFALFAFSGWNMLGAMTQELKEPARDVPKIYVLGMFSVTAISVLFCISWYSVLPFSMLNVSLAAPFAKVVAGNWLRTLLSVLVALSSFGSANGMIMASSRVVCAASKEGDFPKLFSRCLPNGSPWIAILFFTLWSSFLVAILDDIMIAVTFYTVGQWCFFIVAILACIRLKYSMPEVFRPYSVHIILPIIFVVLSSGIVVQQLFLQEAEKVPKWVGFTGFATVVSGWLIYYLKEKICPSKMPSAGVELATIASTHTTK